MRRADLAKVERLLDVQPDILFDTEDEYGSEYNMRHIFIVIAVFLSSLAFAQNTPEKVALIGCEEDYCTVIGVQSIKAVEFAPKNGVVPAYRVVHFVGEKRDVDRDTFEKKAERLSTGEAATALYNSPLKGKSLREESFVACSNTHMQFVFSRIEDGVYSVIPINVSSPAESSGEVMTQGLYMAACHYEDVVDTGRAVGNRHTLKSLGYPELPQAIVTPQELMQFSFERTRNLPAMLRFISEVRAGAKPQPPRAVNDVMNSDARESGKIKCVLTSDGENKLRMISKRTKEDANEARDIDLCNSSNECTKMDFFVTRTRSDIIISSRNGTTVGYITVSDIKKNTNQKDIDMDNVRQSLFVVRYANGVMQLAGICGGSLFE